MLSLRTRLAAFTLITLIPTTAALADDLTPPVWRGQAGTTFQHWNFSSGNAGVLPDGAPHYNPYGTPNLVITNPANWLPTFAGRNDVWAVNDFDFLRFDIPNTGISTHTKDLVLQVTFFAGQIPQIGVQLMASSGSFTMVGQPVQTALPGGWIHEVSYWTNTTCPAFEAVKIIPPVPGTVAFVDQVVIDTRCIPAPGAAAFACLSLAALRRRR